MNYTFSIFAQNIAWQDSILRFDTLDSCANYVANFLKICAENGDFPAVKIKLVPKEAKEIETE